jgi:hypothetical protein
MRISTQKDDTPFVMSIPEMLRDMGQDASVANVEQLWITMQNMCINRDFILSVECDFAKGICVITPVTRPLLGIDELNRKRAAHSTVRGVAQKLQRG